MFNRRGKELISFLGYLAATLAMATRFQYFWVLTFVGVPQTKLIHRFSPNFQDMLTLTGSTVD